MIPLFGRKVIFFGGKGGVGKTTCSAAAALAASREGRRVLLVSTDPAHSTSDVLERPLAAEIREILPCLSAIEIDDHREARRYVDRAKEQMTSLFSPSVVQQAARQIELAATMPGLAEAALFDRIGDIVLEDSDRFDLVVFDTAPTGHTLRLLQMPELMESWMRALAERRRSGVEAGAAASGRNPADDVAADPVLASLDRRARRLTALRDRLRSPATGFVLVVVPERLPIEETARAAHGLEDSGLTIIAVVVNRVLPEGLAGAFYEARREQERRYLGEIDRRFAAWPRTAVPQLERDVYGLAQLERVAASLCGAVPTSPASPPTSRPAS